MIELNMPRLSDSMEEGTIVRWIVEDGSTVQVGDELAEIETDKAILPLEAGADGRLHIDAPEGATLPVGTTIGWLLADNETAPEGRLTGGNDAGPAEPSDTAQALAIQITVAAAERESTARANATVNASPIARRTATRLGVELASVGGSGPNGRIMKADVLRAHEQAVALSTCLPAKSNGRGELHAIPLTRLQQTVARRMTESKATTPEFTLTIEVDMERAVSLRTELKEVSQRAPSINDLVIKALALALRRHPELNASYDDSAVKRFPRVNIGVAVAGKGTLLVPTVFDADLASVAGIAAETRRLAERARAGQLTPQEMANSTATVSNLGMFGIKQFVGILNPPEAMILAVGSVERRAVATDGGIEARQRMTVTGTFDHRVVYGAQGAEFLATFRGLLEQPLQLLV